MTESLVVLRPCEICGKPCDDREAWAVAIDGDIAHHSCLRDLMMRGTLIDARKTEADRG